ncbi:hypothetical protein HU200_000410 [Digitaria exilis]|uniref:Uncharacterized protein n=1 Tax=Digitaria exilis TaxID=1010633 RepID=A0A835G0P2_9POAL|nr:hypothetical protein HU200_000410 [Digitaria exilis]
MRARKPIKSRPILSTNQHMGPRVRASFSSSSSSSPNPAGASTKSSLLLHSLRRRRPPAPRLPRLHPPQVAPPSAPLSSSLCSPPPVALRAAAPVPRVEEKEGVRDEVLGGTAAAPGLGNGRDLSGGPPCGQVRVLVVGDSVARPAQTIGCAVGVKLLLGSGGPGGLPVPYLVIANKVDIAPRDARRVSSGNLVDVARQWVEKQGLLSPSEELPLADSFPGNSGLLTVKLSNNIMCCLMSYTLTAYSVVVHRLSD